MGEPTVCMTGYTDDFAGVILNCKYGCFQFCCLSGILNCNYHVSRYKLAARAVDRLCSVEKVTGITG